MKILLISCGDVATEAGLRFAALGHEVTGWRRNSSKLPAPLHGQDVDLQGDEPWPRIDPETRIAVLTPVPASRDVPGYERAYLQVAGKLVAALKEQAPQLERLIYVSSSAVSGGDHGDWVDESTPSEPNRETSVVLARTEQALLDSGLPVTVLRASGIYGPGRNHLITQVRNGTARLPFGSHWTNRIHRDDLARAIVHVAELGDLAEQLYLVTDNEPAQLEDIFTFLAGELDLPIPPAAAEPAARRAADRRIDNSKLLSTGFTLAFPGYREGYRSVLAGESSRHP
ncbi:NAD-dependent epimerase/dehydratase family protein [Glutamicibacter soli]